MSNPAKITQVCREVQRQFPEALFDLRLALDNVVEVNLVQNVQKQHEPASCGYDIGCIQTLVEGLVVASLADDGAIDLEAPVGRYLPELSERGSRPGNDIRVQHLLAHATGYHAHKAGGGNWRDLVEHLSFTKPAFPAGAVCSWNGLGRTILVPLIQRATGIALDHLVREKVVEVTGKEPTLLNVARGWPTFLIMLDDLLAYVHGVFASGRLSKRLRNCLFPVVRNPISARSGAPVGYALGLALYPDGLWGQTANGSAYKIGLRIHELGNFRAALAIDATPFSRDLVLQLLCTTCGFLRPNNTPHVMGSILDCTWKDVSGTYTADPGDLIRVTATSEGLSCEFSRNGVHIANVQLELADGEVIIGDGRWDTHQIEFFRHPTNGTVCLTFGQISYIRNPD